MSIIPGERHTRPFAESADVCVIGSGAGGAVAAAELAERGYEVVLLEEGSHHDPETFTAGPLEMMRRLYRDGSATATLGVPGIPVPLGRCLGGTTTINSGTCFRTPPGVLETWRRDHGLTLDEATLDPYFARVEERIGVQSAPAATLSGNASVVARGAGVLGWHHLPLSRNVRECRGSGVCAFGCPRSAKQSTLVSYIPRALAQGARVLTDCRAARILHDGRRARGVQGWVLASGTGRRRFPFRVRARAVVLAAGAIHSPGLLSQSGLSRGPFSPVGRHLRIHPATKVAALLDEPLHAWAGVPQGYCVDQFHREGILLLGASPPVDIGGVLFQLVGRRLVELMEAYERVAAFAVMAEDPSCGRVRIGPGGRPMIFYNVGREVLERIKRGVELIGTIFLEAGASRLFPMVQGFPEVRDRRGLEDLRSARIRPRDIFLSAYHPLGTCRIGKDPLRSVIDTNHQAHDLPGLYICDGSAVPTSVAVNPQETIMALATRAAEKIAARLS
jgi:choline dehydrogenase-like flavoprotein